MTTQWFALRIASRGEFRADEELAQAGIERFTPTFKRRTLVRYTKGREKTVELPLLPGFCFAQLDYGPHSHHPAKLKKCKHIIGPIRVCGVPAPIIGEGVEQFEHLRLLCESGQFDQGKKRGHDNRFKDGQPVKIHGGPLAGLEARFRETCGGMRPRAGFVRVVLDKLFGARMDVDVPRELVEAA